MIQIQKEDRHHILKANTHDPDNSSLNAMDCSCSAVSLCQCLSYIVVKCVESKQHAKLLYFCKL